MIFNMTGGSNPLNFKVVGNPQPENPKGNTIWVNTDVSITSWIFSATEPEAPAAGMVWFSTGADSNAEFNALKKNCIMVYPLSAKQYVSGAWAYKDAKIYQSGEWVNLVEWKGELYEAGFDWSHITGGWVAETRNVGDGYNKFAPAITDNGTSITAAMNNNYTGVGFMVTKNDIDLTGWNTLTVEISGYASVNDDNSGVVLAVINRASTDSNGCRVATASCGVNTFAKKTVTLNVASLSGKYAIGLHLYNGGTTRNQSATVYSMKLS